MKIGYARVSTEEQNLDLQRRALLDAQCDIIYEDHGISGTKEDRHGLKKALRQLQAGDVLVVWKLDRLGRSLKHLVNIIDVVAGKGGEFQSVSEKIDTMSAGGRLYFHMLAALAEFERGLIAERTRAGMQAARARGVRLGRPRKQLPL